MKGVKYIVTCQCGKGLWVGLSAHESRQRSLNKFTTLLVNLFEYFHGEHGGAVTKRFSDEPAPDCDHPSRAEEKDSRP